MSRIQQNKIRIKHHCCKYVLLIFQSFNILIFIINHVNGNISFSKDGTNSETNGLRRYSNEEITRIFDLTNMNRHRMRRSTDLRLISASAETGSSFPWKKRYYVTRWHRRRFVPSVNSREDGSLLTAAELSTVPRRLCGIKLTNRTRELCGECGPANMQRVELMDKKADKSVASRERLTQMCCEKRCTDEDIRSYCCRS
uniref:Insulin-like domain-containing protein n=1 Tax=Meloidogyne incognita TaxID=6306 RepID=A0A914N6P2_MELIC